jgi:hypothetical protein
MRTAARGKRPEPRTMPLFMEDALWERDKGRRSKRDIAR